LLGLRQRRQHQQRGQRQGERRHEASRHCHCPKPRTIDALAISRGPATCGRSGHRDR
jgi:hypothetical protein